MTTMDWICLGLAPFTIAACFYAKHVSKKQRAKWAKDIKALERMHFGPMCRCGHRISVHVPGPMSPYPNYMGCQMRTCPCIEYKGEE